MAATHFIALQRALSRKDVKALSATHYKSTLVYAEQYIHNMILYLLEACRSHTVDNIVALAHLLVHPQDLIRQVAVFRCVLLPNTACRVSLPG